MNHKTQVVMFMADLWGWIMTARGVMVFFWEEWCGTMWLAREYFWKIYFQSWCVYIGKKVCINSGSEIFIYLWLHMEKLWVFFDGASWITTWSEYDCVRNFVLFIERENERGRERERGRESNEKGRLIIVTLFHFLELWYDGDTNRSKTTWLPLEYLLCFTLMCCFLFLCLFGYFYFSGTVSCFWSCYISTNWYIHWTIENICSQRRADFHLL